MSEKTQTALHSLYARDDGTTVVTSNYKVRPYDKHIGVFLGNSNITITLPPAGTVPEKQVIVEVVYVDGTGVANVVGDGVLSSYSYEGLSAVGSVLVLLSTGNQWVSLFETATT